MKKNFYQASLAVTILIVIRSSTFGQGFITVIQHSGNADPVAEGFTLSTIGSQASIGPVTNNGVAAWNTTVSNVNNNISYVYFLTPQQQAETIGTDWLLSFTLQDLQPSSIANDVLFVGGAFGIGIGSEDNGDPYLGISKSNPEFVLSGGGSGYHDYQVRYDAGTETVALWIDGTERISNYLQNISIPNGITQIEWGESQGGPSSANWNLISFEVIPEPSVFSLIFLGGGILAYVHKRNKKHSAKSKDQR